MHAEAKMAKPLINVDEATTHHGASGDLFGYSMTELAGALGAKTIGANITRVPPGKAAFPFHHHHANEEHFFVLSGSGVLRHGAETHAVRKNDYVVHLAGGPESAHQLINTGAEDLVYLAISTNAVPDVVGYPDSSKTGVRTAAFGEEDSRFLLSDGNKNTVSYWEREDGKRVAQILDEHT
jgi:uncharacterized cupin superfamily protein